MAAINEAALPWRMDRAEADIAKKADKDYVDSIAAEVRGLRKAVLVAALSFVGGAGLVSFSLLITVGSHLG